MKGILIDPFTRTITNVLLTNNWRDINKHLDCNTFTIVHYDEWNDIFIDDEGLYVDNQAFFGFKENDDLVLAGKALALGHDGKGETSDTNLNINELTENIIWLEPIDRPDIKFEITGF